MRQYFAVARFRFLSENDVATFNTTVESKPIVLRNLQTEQKRLHDLLFNDSEEERPSVKFDFFVGLDSNAPFMTAEMKIVDVPRYDHFDKADDQYPENATYLLYGDVGNAYLFHTPTKYPDYLQVGRVGRCGKKIALKIPKWSALSSKTKSRSCELYSKYKIYFILKETENSSLITDINIKKIKLNHKIIRIVKNGED